MDLVGIIGIINNDYNRSPATYFFLYWELEGHGDTMQSKIYVTVDVYNPAKKTNAKTEAKLKIV
jgi:hypothetical protein